MRHTLLFSFAVGTAVDGRKAENDLPNELVIEHNLLLTETTKAHIRVAALPPWREIALPDFEAPPPHQNIQWARVLIQFHD